MTEFKASASTEINASAESIWEVLTSPEKIAIYLYGTQTETDWQAGSPIKFTGNYNGTEYHDKGKVLENNPHKLLKYSYWSSMSRTEDKPENYFIVSYILEVSSSKNIKLTWLQTNMSSTKSVEHTEQGLPSMLNKIKELAEA